MKTWKKHFTGTILSRGLDYYDAGTVRIITCSNRKVNAKVNDYDTDIYLKDSKITSMYCTCPYEGNCKHLAALLYYIEDNPILIKARKYDYILEKLSHGELVEFLSSELADNPQLLNRLRLFINDPDEDYYTQKLKHSDNILRFMNEDLNDLITYKHYNLLFRLCKMIIDYVNDELEYGYSDRIESIVCKLDDITTLLRDVEEAHEPICDFLEYAVKSSDNIFILEIMTDAMSRNGDITRLD